jgi:hypothetical protein
VALAAAGRNPADLTLPTAGTEAVDPPPEGSHESPWWEGTKAFGASLWQNTGGAVYSIFTGEAGRALGERAYQKSVQRGNENPGIGTILGLAGEDLIGAQAIEGIYGYDLATGQSLEGGERTQRLASGVAAFAGSAAGLAGGVARFTPLGPKMIPPKTPARVLAAEATPTVEAAEATAIARATSGGRWRWGYGAIREGEAEAAYQAIRESTTDVSAISRYTGYKADRIQGIKDYLFNNPEWTGADSDIAAAWHRLRTGRGTEVDRLLLKHETAEMWMRRARGADYWEAHRRANQHWNWQRAIEEGGR